MGCSCLKSNVVIKSNIQPSNNFLNNSNDLNNISNNNSNENINNIENNEEINNQNSNQNNENSNNNNQNMNFLNFNTFEPYLQSKNDPNFNYPEIENEYVGKGLKRMKGYISSIPLNELKKVREDFWSSRIEGNSEIWELLHVICSDDSLSEEEINNLMRDGGIIPYNNCINITYDNKGALYEIPNYCINLPFKYNDDNNHKKNKPKEDNIIIIIRYFINEDKIKISNWKLVSDLKNELLKFKRYKNIDNVKNFRIFFGGKELSDDKELWYYNFLNGSICQLLLKKENNENEEIKEKNNDNLSENMTEKPKIEEINNSKEKNLEETFHKLIDDM